MITQIRKGLQSRSARYLVSALIIGTFAFSTLIMLWQYATEGRSNWVMKVNGVPIGISLYTHERRQQNQLLENLRLQYGDLAPLLLQMSGLPTDVESLTEQSLIQSALLNEQAKKAGINPSPAYVQEQIAHPDKGLRLLSQVMPVEVLTATGVDSDRLAHYLTRMGLGSGDLEHLLEQAVARAMLLETVAALTYVPQFYIDHERMLRRAERTVSLAVSPVTPSSEPITQDEVEAFYQDEIKRGAYTTPEKRAAKVWRFDPDSYQIKVTSAQAQDFYDRNKQTFIQDPAKLSIAYAIFTPNEQFDQEATALAAQELHDRVAASPDQFEELVAQAQQDGVGVQFEKPDPVERGELVDMFGHEFDRRIFSLTTNKSIAPVIDTPQGVVIVQRLDKQKRRYKSFDSVEDDIRDQIRQERFAKRFTADAQAQTLNNDDSTAFDAFARKHNATEQSIALHAQGDNRYDQYIFSAKQNEQVPFVDGQVGIVIEVTEIEPARAREFSDIKKQVEDDLRLARGRTAWGETVDRLVQELKNKPNSLEEEAKQSGFTLQTVTLAEGAMDEATQTLSSYGIDPQQLLSLAYPGALTSSAHTTPSEDYVYIARLDGFSDLVSEGVNDQKDSVGSYVQNIARSVQNGYVATLRKNATIEVNSSLPLPS